MTFAPVSALEAGVFVAYNDCFDKIRHFIVIFNHWLFVINLI